METGWKRAGNGLKTSQPAPPRSRFWRRDPGGAGWFFSHINTHKRAGNEMEYVISSAVNIIPLKFADLLKGISEGIFLFWS